MGPDQKFIAGDDNRKLPYPSNRGTAAEQEATFEAVGQQARRENLRERLARQAVHAKISLVRMERINTERT